MKTTALLLVLAVALQAAHGQNLLVNGDFESGNTGFFSTYTFARTDSGEGTYDVVQDPHDSHFGGASFKDHTTGAGFMLVANGSPDTNDIVWSQTVPVAANRTYAFSGWGATWGHEPGQDFDPSPPAMRIFINNTQSGGSVQLQARNGQWQSFTALWNSESSTQAVIQIRLATTALSGNDIALDDFRFAPLTTNQFALVTIYRSVEVQWQSLSNRLYQVQWAPTLSSDTWFDLGSPVLATDDNMSAWDRVLTWENRFYRVLSLE